MTASLDTTLETLEHQAAGRAEAERDQQPVFDKVPSELLKSLGDTHCVTSFFYVRLVVTVTGVPDLAGGSAADFDAGVIGLRAEVDATGRGMSLVGVRGDLAACSVLKFWNASGCARA